MGGPLEGSNKRQSHTDMTDQVGEYTGRVMKFGLIFDTGQIVKNRYRSLSRHTSERRWEGGQMTQGRAVRAWVLILFCVFGATDHAFAVSDGVYVGQAVVDASSAPGCRPGASYTVHWRILGNHLHFTWGHGVVKIDTPVDGDGAFSDTQPYDAWGGGGGFVPDTLNVSGVATEQTISAEMHGMYCRYSVRLAR
jgi:hypothetical protein